MVKAVEIAKTVMMVEDAEVIEGSAEDVVEVAKAA